VRAESGWWVGELRIQQQKQSGRGACFGCAAAGGCRRAARRAALPTVASVGVCKSSLPLLLCKGEGSVQEQRGPLSGPSGGRRTMFSNPTVGIFFHPNAIH